MIREDGVHWTRPITHLYACFCTFAGYQQLNAFYGFMNLKLKEQHNEQARKEIISGLFMWDWAMQHKVINRFLNIKRCSSL